MIHTQPSNGKLPLVRRSLPNEAARPIRSPSPARGTPRLDDKVRQLQTYLEDHPNRDQALDRLLDDMDHIAAQREQAEYDMRIDNDFDGLG